MGFIGKIKNILFEEEEVEEKSPKSYKEDIVEDKSEIKKEEKKPVLFDYDMDDEIDVDKKEEKSSSLSERDLFGNDNSFKFPSFDEQEFETKLPKSRVSDDDDYNYPTKKENSRDSLYERDVRNTYSRDYREQREPIKDVYKKEYREVKEPVYRKPEKKLDFTTYGKVEEKKKFKPSPIISPVYGIMDKDYVKEELPKKKEDEPKRRNMTIESVRRKAFGSLEDEIEETITAPREDFIRDVEMELDNNPEEIIKQEKKNIEDLLKNTVDEEIVVPTSLDDYDNTINDIEEELEKYDDVSLQKQEEKLEEGIIPEKELEELEDLDKKSTDSDDEDDTLEQDLFELIDSMYDDRKGGAE